ncbi:YpzG family protein [Pontibacillus yanchengensis]|uniref:YpzG family protein n=2 Tax=Pontibacillus yanchengensis TaxID=462910 RepID=A0ACC7VIV8_9BACI|nr:YpzG family protein [Pontibacillus yanchengensis]MYL35285.1 YpzG family protein [Pontibacillus yanchengensis]MYL54896.1 YpzG family protein [Pontibacillus yanchengensis]
MGQNSKKREENKRFLDNLYKDPFQSPNANPKHAANQVNGETQQTQSEIITEVQMRKRS